jgi:lipoprotein-anchoring transpeptidase ErfK/SrfK
MQRIVLTALALSAGVFPALGEPITLEPSLYPPNYSRASLESRYVPVEEAALRQPPQRAIARVDIAATAQPQRPEPAPAPRTRLARNGQLGGGFIEFIFGGDDTSRREPQPVAAPAVSAAPSGLRPATSIEDIYAPRRTAAVPVVRTLGAIPPMDTRFLPTVVDYNGREPAGTIIINTPERFLYLVNGDGTARRYGIGVGRPGFTWAGAHKITAKREWPDWYPPEEMLKRQPYLPVHMPGGLDNPLGARAMYLGSTLYRIHGSNEPWTIGHAVSSGCIRMRNEDVIDLYDRVSVGTKVVVI